MTSVTFRGIGKRFGPVHAVSGLELEIPQGEFCVFVGPSGCGKTTALRMLAGLEKPTRGQILLGERDVTHERAMDRNIAMVFQNYALYPHMTVAQNMGFALRMQKVDASAVAERTAKAARMLAIENLLERFPRQLSGGQRQRVAVGRAIVRDPEVFLFDEPLSNLDAKLRNSARVELKDLQLRLGTTTVYVTHDQVEAMTMADRIVLMNEGRVLQVGRPMELYDNPASTYVATFMGSPAMNLLPARVLRSVDGGCMLDMDGIEVPVRTGLREGTVVTLGIRPEQIVIGSSNGESAATIAVSVVQIEELGGETILHTQAKDKRIIVKTGAHAGIREKDVLSLRLPPSAIRLFDQDKGLRLA